MLRSLGCLPLVLIVSVPLLPACSDRPPQGMVTRDSSGVEIVEHPSLGGGQDFELRGELDRPTLPAAVHGEEDGGSGPRPAFTRISAMDLGPEGLLYVLDGIEGTVTVLDPEHGGVVRRFGRRGQGPGEFRSAADLRVTPGGQVLVGERIPLRIHRFSAQGSYQGVARLDPGSAPRSGQLRAGRAAALAEWRLLPGGDLVARILTLEADPTRPGRNRLVRVSAEGEFRSVILRWSEPGSLADPPPLLSARRSWTTGGTGQVHYSDGERYEIRTLDTKGRLRRILRLPVRPRAVGSRQRELALQAFRESMTEGGAPARMVEEMAADLEVARQLPAIHGLWSDPERGELWVGVPTVDGSRGELSAGEYHLFGAGGRFLGRVVTPPGFRLHAVRSRRMLGSAVDELGVPHPRVYRIHRGEAGGNASD